MKKYRKRLLFKLVKCCFKILKANRNSIHQKYVVTRNTVIHRTEEVSQNLEYTLLEPINKCIVLLLQLDKCTDYTGTAELNVFI